MGDVPLLERVREQNGSEHWQPRCTSKLDNELSKQYGLPIEISRKIAGLAAIGRALDSGDLALAQIATLHLQIPDPPPLNKSAQSPKEIVQLALRLQAGNLLKADWDPDKHPRRPAGSPDGVGGEFAPADSGIDAGNSGASLIPVQEAVPIPMPPFDIPIPRTGPLPFEILPPPIAVPQTNPKDLPKNPYPRNPKCVKEWEDAEDTCEKLKRDGKLGPGDDGRNRSWGKWMYECLMGHVSEECGGNSTNAFEIA